MTGFLSFFLLLIADVIKFYEKLIYCFHDGLLVYTFVEDDRSRTLLLMISSSEIGNTILHCSRILARMK